MNILTILIQIGMTLVTMMMIFMVFAILDYRGGIDEFVGMAIFQPIMAFIFTVVTIMLCGFIGLPIRLNKRLNKWWRTEFYFSILISFVGFILCSLSFISFFKERVAYIDDGINKMVEIPNLYLAISGWMLIGFGILHTFPPYKLQHNFATWINRKFNIET